MESLLRYAGKITEWNDERGFGFIVPNGGGARAFVHISELKTRSRRPATGAQVTYSVAKDPRGRLQATVINLIVARHAPKSQDSSFPLTTIGVTALILVAIAYDVHKLPPIVAGAYFLFSIISFFAYMRDKHAAARDAWRTPESTLHLLDLVGGWPGGIIAQRMFHHKTVKQSFQFGFWLSVLANIGGVWWLTVSGLAAQLTASVAG
jgi:uncharacterized membrane protein YsdA (DUF1294 family)/cold shock CspA family protein